MADEIKNVGSKGYFFLVVFIAFLLFIILWSSVYYANQDFLPPQ